MAIRFLSLEVFVAGVLNINIRRTVVLQQFDEILDLMKLKTLAVSRVAFNANLSA